MKNIDLRFNELEEIIKKPKFRENKGLGNEVGYYIFDYDASDELIVRDKIKNLVKKYEGEEDFKILVFDLYDIIIDYLEQEKVLDKSFLEMNFEFEKDYGFDEIIAAVNETLNIDKDNESNYLLSYIKSRTYKNTIVFLTGVGKCYPIVRSHKVLNNLHQYVDDVPVVMFYPGKYDGVSLILFDKIKDDNYYRAFKLVQ